MAKIKDELRFLNLRDIIGKPRTMCAKMDDVKKYFIAKCNHLKCIIQCIIIQWCRDKYGTDCKFKWNGIDFSQFFSPTRTNTFLKNQSSIYEFSKEKRISNRKTYDYTSILLLLQLNPYWIANFSEVFPALIHLNGIKIWLDFESCVCRTELGNWDFSMESTNIKILSFCYDWFFREKTN